MAAKDVSAPDEIEWGEWRDTDNLIPARGKGSYFAVDVTFPKGIIASVKNDQLVLKVYIEVAGTDVFERPIGLREYYTTSGAFFEKGFLNQRSASYD